MMAGCPCCRWLLAGGLSTAAEEDGGAGPWLLDAWLLSLF